MSRALIGLLVVVLALVATAALSAILLATLNSLANT
jgi:hypothetical protein